MPKGLYERLDADGRRWESNQITERIIGCAFTVGNNLGCGFLEKVYENALAHELPKAGLRVTQQFPIHIYYDGIVVGDYVADLLVEGRILVELKAIKNMGDKEFAQCLNYIKATRLNLCLLINFGNPKVEIKRVVKNF